MSDIDHIRNGLQCSKPRCECHSDRGNVHCPSHVDDTPSLALSERNGKILWHCFAGCSQDEVLAALQNKGLLNRSGESSRVVIDDDRGITLEQYAAIKRLPIAELERWGCSDVYYSKKPAIRITYRDTDGEIVAVRFRTGAHEFKWRSGDKPILYGLWRPRGEDVVLVEGESDCHTLWHYGIDALGVPGANNWRESQDAQHLKGTKTVYVVIEPDSGGEAVLGWLETSEIRDRARIVRLDGFKDPSEMHITDPSKFLERWNSAIAKSESWAEYYAAKQNLEAAQAWAQCENLALAPDLLDRIGEIIRKKGYVGDLSPALIAYLALTSRVLERPLNLAFIAPSGAGKNHAVNSAAELVPEEDYYVVKASSARAIIFSDRDYQHKVVIFSEADSIPEDGAAASAIRALADENYMAYDIVEKSERTGVHKTRHIVKRGPTGLITTSTRPLGEQLSTRILEIPIPDDPQQTAAIFEAHALGVMPHDENVDIAPFLALQRWIKAQGEQRVSVPFARILSQLVPPVAVRMRRDFRQLLTAIQTVALLYQAQREKQDGYIIATIDDYRIARELLAPIFDIIKSEGVSRAIREVVAAIKPEEEVTEAELARRLKLPYNTVRYRVKRALKGGWLVNSETRPHYPRKLSLGVPIPEDKPCLPTVEQIIEAINNAQDSQSVTVNRDNYQITNKNGKTHTPPPPPFEGGGGGYVIPESFAISRLTPQEAELLKDFQEMYGNLVSPYDYAAHKNLDYQEVKNLCENLVTKGKLWRTGYAIESYSLNPPNLL